jgi:hypothetical protein
LSAEQLRDIRVILLREMYRVQPRGRTARSLHNYIQAEVACAIDDVEAQIHFLVGETLLWKFPADKLSPGIDPFFAITSAGMKFAEEQRLI